MGIRVRRSGCAGCASAGSPARAAVREDHRRSLHVPVEAERHRRYGLPRRGLVSPDRSPCPRDVAGPAGAAEFRRRRLRGQRLGQRRSRRAAIAAGIRQLRARHHRSAQASANNIVVVRVYDPATDMDDSAWQAVLEAEVREHLLHAHDRLVAARVDRSGAGATRIGRLRDHAGRRQVAGTPSRPTSCRRPNRRPGPARRPALRLRVTATLDGTEQAAQEVSVSGTRAASRADARTTSACGGRIARRCTT